MMVCILFLHGPVESLAMSVLFRCPRTGFVVSEVKDADCFSEVLLELRTIVGEYVCKRKREYLADDLEEF